MTQTTQTKPCPNGAESPYNITLIETSEQLSPHLPNLQSLLQHHVNDDPSMSSLGFKAPLTDVDAAAWWQTISNRLDQENTPGAGPKTYYQFILTSKDDTTSPPNILAIAAVMAYQKANHYHRAEIVKVLVHPSQQRKGLGQIMMRHAEAFAKHDLKREVLMLDTATETPAVHFYRKLGWKEWGVCPEYADYADGRRGDVTFFVKIIRD